MPIGSRTPTSERDPVAEQQAEDEHDASIGGFKGWVIGAGKGLDDTFSAETVHAYAPNATNFNLGGQAGFANQRAGALGASGNAIAQDLRSAGTAGLTSQQQQAAQYLGYGAQGAQYGQQQAGQYQAQGQAGNALQQARALGFGDQAATAQTDAARRTASQQNTLTNLQGNATHAANEYGDKSWLAGRREFLGVGVADQRVNDANRDLEAQGRAQQLAAANTLGYRANDGAGFANTAGLRNYAATTGSGPSAAQAQLQQGRDASMASALALARSGRGNNTAAIRGAMFQNAATQAQTNQQLAQQRALEFDQAQNRQLGALSAESQALQGYRGQDLNALQAQASALGQARAQDQAQQQLGIGQGQFAAQQALQNRQLNDATALAWAQQAQAAQARGDQLYLSGQGLGNQQLAQAQQYGLGLQGLGNQSLVQGQQFELGKDALANAAAAQGQQYQLGMGGLANQATGQGLSYNAALQGQANQTWLGAQGLASGTYGQQLQADMGYEDLAAQQYLAAQQSNQQADTQRDAANTGMLGGLMGAIGLSDERSKREIKNLKGQIADAVALGYRPAHADFDDAYQGSNMPETEYPRMPENTRGPRFDLRNAQGYAFKYKNPSTPGAAPGQQYGVMAQDLERSPVTRSTVVQGQDGLKRVDTPRLTMINTAALGEQQRDIQEIKSILSSNNQPANDPGFDRDALDEAYKRSAGWH